MHLVSLVRAAVSLGTLLFGVTMSSEVLAQPSFEGLFKMAIEAAKQRKAPDVVETPASKPKSAGNGVSNEVGFSQAGSMTLLYDTDLPYNDYRSGMQDPALKGISLGECQNYCEAEGRCNAFTYNSNARVCFLKSAVADPERFRGAISGVKGQTGLVAAANSSSRELTRAEIAQLQRGLNALGYDVGKPDGKVGKKTRAAIASFVAAHPGQATTNVDVALLLAVTSGGTAPQTTPTDSGFAELNALAAGNPVEASADAPLGEPPAGTVFERIEIERAAENNKLFRMLVAARPSLLEDREVLANLYKNEGRTFTSSYRVEEELDAFKLEYLGRPTPRQIYLELESSAWLQRSQYSREDQLFPFDRRWDDTTDRFLKFRVGGEPSYVAEFSVPTMPEVRGVPMTLEEAEAFERERMSGRDGLMSLRLLRKVVISDVTFNDVRGVFEAEVGLFGVEAVEAYGDNKDAVLYAWAPIEPKPMEAPRAVEPLATLAGLAETLPGLAIVDGRLNLRQSPGWPAFAASLFLTSEPNAMGDSRLLVAMARSLLTIEEQETLWRGELPYNWQHIYDLRGAEFDRTASVLAKDYAATIASRAIKPEVGIVDVREATFGAFDATKGLFTLSLGEAGPGLGDRDTGATIAWSYPGTVLPSSLPVDQDMARKLIEQLGGDPTGQTAYVAVFADVTGATANRNPDGYGAVFRVTLDAATTRIALYKDAALTEMIFDFYADPEGPLLTEQKRQNELLALRNLASPSVDALHQLAATLSGDASYLPDLVAATLKDRQLNEFERTSFTDGLQAGLAGQQVPDPLWIKGSFRLGEYSMERKAFAIDTSTMRMNYEGSRLGLADDGVQFAFTEIPTEIAVPFEQAKAYVERTTDSREVDVRYRLTPLQVVVDRTRYGEIIPTITYHVDQMVVMAPNRDTPFGTELLADIDYGAFAGVATTAQGDAVAATPLADRPLFTQEFAAALAFGDGSTPLTETEYRRLLGSRWLIEQGAGFASATPDNFFQVGAQLPAAATLDLYREDFSKWLAAAGRTAPKHLQLRVDLRDDHMKPRPPAFCSDMQWGLRYVFQNQALAVQLFGEAGGGMQDLQMRQVDSASDADPAVLEPMLLGFPYASAASCEIEPSRQVSQALGLEGVPEQSAFVVLDRMPMPDFLGGHSAYTEAVVDVAVTEIMRRPSGNGLPVLVVFATFEGATFNTVEVSDNQRRVVASVPFTAESVAPASLSLDVLGITIGMSEAEADAKVRAHIKDAKVISSVVDLSPAMPSFSDVTAYFDPGLKERIALFYEVGTAERTVLGVHRVIAAPDWSLPRADVSGAAIGKYGPPAFEEYGEYATSLAWGPGGANRDCRDAADSHDFPDTWRDEGGQTGGLASFVDWSTIRDNGLSILPQPSWDAELQRCEGVMLLKHTERFVETFLVDPALYYSAWQASMAKAKDMIAEKSKGNGSSTIAF